MESSWQHQVINKSVKVEIFAASITSYNHSQMQFILMRILPVLFVLLLIQEAHWMCFALLCVPALHWCLLCHCDSWAHVLGDLHTLTSHRNRGLHGNVFKALLWVYIMCKFYGLRLLWIAHVEVWQMGRSDAASHHPLHTHVSLAPHYPSDKSPEPLLHPSLACIGPESSVGLFDANSWCIY